MHRHEVSPLAVSTITRHNFRNNQPGPSESSFSSLNDALEEPLRNRRTQEELNSRVAELVREVRWDSVALVNTLIMTQYRTLC